MAEVTLTHAPPGGAVFPGTGIAIRAPGWQGKAQTVARAGADRRATAARGTIGEATLAEAGLRTQAEIEIEATPPNARDMAVRGVSPSSQLHVDLQQPRPDSGYALLQTDPSGLRRWVFAEPAPAGGLTFTLHEPTRSANRVEEDRRGAIVQAMKIGAHIVSWLTGGLTGAAAQKIAGAWEARRRPYGVRQIAWDGAESDPDWDFLSSGRALLLVHGTFSTPGGGFAGLFGTAEFQSILENHGGRCFAFAHKTLSAGLGENIDQFRQMLPAGKTLDVDILCHSRGGLVSRAIAGAAAAGTLPLKVGKLVMVAAPNRGTPLAKPEHWVEFIDHYTNLLVDLPDSATTITLEGVLCLVKIVGGGGLGGLPGLEAMDGDGEQLKTLGAQSPGAARLAAFIADFTPRADSPLLQLAAKAGGAAVDAFFGEASDLVVPTNGCYDLDKAEGFPLGAAAISRFSGDTVNHVTFFDNAEVRAALVKVFEAKPVLTS